MSTPRTSEAPVGPPSSFGLAVTPTKRIFSIPGLQNIVAPAAATTCRLTISVRKISTWLGFLRKFLGSRETKMPPAIAARGSGDKLIKTLGGFRSECSRRNHLAIQGNPGFKTNQVVARGLAAISVKHYLRCKEQREKRAKSKRMGRPAGLRVKSVRALVEMCSSRQPMWPSP